MTMPQGVSTTKYYIIFGVEIACGRAIDKKISIYGIYPLFRYQHLNVSNR